MASKSLSRESQLSIAAAPFLYKSSFTRALPWRIKQLVSHRRSRTFEDGTISIAGSDRRLGGKSAGKPVGRGSWIEDSASSDASLIDDGNEDQPRTDVRPSSSPSLSHSLSSSPKILYFRPDEDHADLSGDALSWSLIFSATEKLSAPSSQSTFDLLEALSLEPSEEDDLTPTPTPTAKLARYSPENTPGRATNEGIERLIREADEAFKGPSTVLVPGSFDPVYPNADTKEESQNTDLDRQVLKKRQRKMPTARSSSISKAKRTKSTKKKARLLDLASTLPPAGPSPSQNQRWTQLADMTENISEIFSGRRFGKMEVHEMIDTTRIRRLPKPASKGSMEFASGHGTDDFAEAIRDSSSFENPQSRLDCSAGTTAVPPDLGPPVQGSPSEAPTIPLKSALRKSRRDSAIYVGNGISILTSPEKTDISMPPLASLRNRSRSYPKQPSLPTIEEASPSTPDSNTPAAAASATTPALQATSAESFVAPAPLISHETNHILLTSTPFTLTAPHFRHGSIRLPRGKKRAVKSANSSFTAAEPGDMGSLDQEGASALDWTAFQMAISGGTGNYLMGGLEPDEPDATAEETEELASWWTGFGFGGEGMGRLIEAGPVTAASSTTTHHHHRRKRSKRTSGDVSIAYELDTAAAATAIPEDATTRGHEGMADTSLPPSPVDDLAVLERGSLQAFQLGDVVPMGSNLSHDLDDYLLWEQGASSLGALARPGIRR